MRIIAAHLLPYALPLVKPWRSASATVVERCGWLLRLETDNACVGHGECAPLPSHGTESQLAAGTALAQWAKAVRGQEPATALKALATPESFATPAARAAVETALLDLLAQRASCSLADYLRRSPCSTDIAVNTMIGAAINVTDSQIKAAVAAGFSVIKMKLGLAPVADELAALTRLAPLLPAGTRLRFDANRAWQRDTVLQACAALAKVPGIDIESIEEPLTQPTADGLRELQQALPFPIALDESWPILHAARIFDTPPVRRLVLKLAPLGGLLPAYRLAQRAGKAGMEVVVTTGIDTACGTLAAAHLAVALGNDLAHGLATASWLAEDMGTPPTITKGRLALPTAIGLGVMYRAGTWG